MKRSIICLVALSDKFKINGHGDTLGLSRINDDRLFMNWIETAPFPYLSHFQMEQKIIFYIVLMIITAMQLVLSFISGETLCFCRKSWTVTHKGL